MHNIGSNLSDELNIMAKSEMLIISTILKSGDKELRVCDIAKGLMFLRLRCLELLADLNKRLYKKDYRQNRPQKHISK